MTNYFTDLNSINVSEKVEKKNNLSYLSWAWAWGELKKLHPDSTYTVYENSAGLFYHTDGMTCWVKTGVTVCGLEHIEYLPVMDYKNKSIPLNSVTSFDVNKTLQRSLTKAIARHGLGLYIYAGEDLPEQAAGIEVVGGSPRTGIAREQQEAMHTAALNLLNACATNEAIDKIVKKYSKSWKETLDEDLYEDIKQKVTETRADIENSGLTKTA